MTDKNQNPDTRINMMDTPFPMRGDLPKREPAWAKQWSEQGLYKKLSFLLLVQLSINAVCILLFGWNISEIIHLGGPPPLSMELVLRIAMFFVLFAAMYKNTSMLAFGTIFGTPSVVVEARKLNEDLRSLLSMIRENNQTMLGG